MRTDTKQRTNMKRTSLNALSGLVLAGLGATAPSPAMAQCTDWDVAGSWQIRQGKFVIPVELKQSGKTLSGSAKHNASIAGTKGFLGVGASFGANQVVDGTVRGTVEGDTFNIEIAWPDALVGVYRGTIKSDGTIGGITYDKKKPSSNSTWSSDRPMKCGNTTAIKPSVILKPKPSAPAAATTPAPKVIKSTGKGPTQETSAAGPRIVAFNKPRQTPGTKTLSWDGGPDHPYAEVWVKVDGQDETFVVEQGKGTREVTVEPGKTYLYILTDSGKRLATVTVSR